VGSGPRLGAAEQAIVDTVAEFVERDVKPVVHDLEATDAYPSSLIETMKQLGVYGLLVPEQYGGVGVSTACFAMVTEELARGWMSLAGAMGGHSVVTYLIHTYGTTSQRSRYLPRLATGSLRATMALTEPSGGSDLQAMRTVAARDEDGFVIHGSKTWISNARRAGLVALLCKTDPDAEPPHRGMSVILVEAAAGYTVSRDLHKLGYRGIETCELTFDGVAVPFDAVLGGEPGLGFTHMMRGLEIGRINVAARALGVARAALDEALAYAQVREAFGKPIWRHQAVGHQLADMATKLRAARLLTLDAAELIDAGRRADLEAGMAKVFASEVCMEVTLSALRIHGAYGYSTEYNLERYFRDAPLMIVGEGTNEIQRNLIVNRLIAGDR
jgi:alkylation response protein AidB-like acyl-CoA dehydrogenase